MQKNQFRWGIETALRAYPTVRVSHLHVSRSNWLKLINIYTEIMEKAKFLLQDQLSENCGDKKVTKEMKVSDIKINNRRNA